ncbi:MAG: glycosyltransferase family 1 protein, partial [Chloroflexota bacterium]
PALVIAGNRGWLFEETMQTIEELNLNKNVYWREKVSQQDLAALYTGALVHLMPSFYEGFGLPALEAMACGTVPIVSHRSSLPEVVGNVGYQIDPDDPQSIADAIEHAITDVNWRMSHESLALERAKQFSWAKTAAVAQQVYEKVME